MFMASFDNVLYIIGNGFDLHHGVMSSFKSFAIWDDVFVLNQSGFTTIKIDDRG